MELTIVAGKPSPEISGKTPTDIPSNEWKDRAIDCIKQAQKILESEAQSQVIRASEHLDMAIEELQGEDDVAKMESTKTDYMDKLQQED